MLPALIGAIGGLAAGGLTHILNDSSSKAQWRRETEFAKNAMQYRVADLRKAGLSPQLVAGSGGATTPSVSAPTADFSQAADALSSGMNNFLSRKQAYALAVENYRIQQQQADSWSKVLAATARERNANASVAEHDARIYTSSPLPSDARALGVPVGAINEQSVADSVETVKNVIKGIARQNPLYQQFEKAIPAAKQLFSNFSTSWANVTRSSKDSTGKAKSSTVSERRQEMARRYTRSK